MIFLKLWVLFDCSEQPTWKKFTWKKKWLFSALKKFKLLHTCTKLSYLALNSMGLWKTSNFSIFTFIKANDLKSYTHSYISCIYRMVRFKSQMEKFAKWCHTLELYIHVILAISCIFQQENSVRSSSCNFSFKHNGYRKGTP